MIWGGTGGGLRSELGFTVKESEPVVGQPSPQAACAFLKELVSIRHSENAVESDQLRVQGSGLKVPRCEPKVA